MFPKFVVSVFAGFVLYLGHDLSCLITGSKFWYCFKTSSVIFSVGGRKILSISSFDDVSGFMICCYVLRDEAEMKR